MRFHSSWGRYNREGAGVGSSGAGRLLTAGKANSMSSQNTMVGRPLFGSTARFGAGRRGGRRSLCGRLLKQDP